jgi:hypothetical protein
MSFTLLFHIGQQVVHHITVASDITLHLDVSAACNEADAIGQCRMSVNTGGQQMSMTEYIPP